jgi:hypothetical protein
MVEVFFCIYPGLILLEYDYSLTASCKASIVAYMKAFKRISVQVRLSVLLLTFCLFTTARFKTRRSTAQLVSRLRMVSEAIEV